MKIIGVDLGGTQIRAGLLNHDRTLKKVVSAMIPATDKE